MSGTHSQAIQLNATEECILKKLLEHGTYMTTTQLANECGMSWNTAFKYLHSFADKKWIIHIEHGNRDMWKAERS